MIDAEIRSKIAQLLSGRCNNCYQELGYYVHAEGWNWVTENFGPFCNDCYSEIKSLLKENPRSATAPKERVGGYDGCTRLRVQSSSSEPVLTREDIDQMRSLLVRCRLLAEECQNFDLVHEIQRMFQALPASASRVGPPNEEK